MFEGQKTRIFWIGIIVLIIGLYFFGNVIYSLSRYFYGYYTHPYQALYFTPWTFVQLEAPPLVSGIILIFVALYLMKLGIKKNNLQTST